MKIRLKKVSVESNVATFNVIVNEMQYTFKVTLQEPFTGLSVLQSFVAYHLSEQVKQLAQQQISSNNVDSLK